MQQMGRTTSWNWKRILDVFPNPVRAYGDVTFNQAVDIYDMQGRLVQSMAAAGVWNANLPAGTYAVVGCASDWFKVGDQAADSIRPALLGT